MCHENSSFCGTVECLVLKICQFDFNSVFHFKISHTMPKVSKIIDDLTVQSVSYFKFLYIQFI